MQSRFSFSTLALAGLLISTHAIAQDSSHWGVQGSYFRGDIPGPLVDKLDSLVEKPDITSKDWDAGVVRFHKDGSPSWAVEYTKMQLSGQGSKSLVDPVRQVVVGSQEIRGSGTIRGVMATKYVNFFSRKYFSGGLAFGGGVGKLEANYYRYQVPPGPIVITERKTYDYTIPTFQIVAQVDVRPVRWVSLSPFYGIRNGTIGMGGTVRIHITR
ncbi:MAG: hypothetical protein ABI824_06235 [Acidobacteriota bacterium]